MKLILSTLLTLSISATASVDLPINPLVSIDPSILKAQNKNTAKKVSVLITLAEPTITGSKPNKYNHKEVVSYLNRRTLESVRILQTELAAIGANRTDITLKNIHWINNSITAKITHAGLRALSQVTNVRKVYLNGKTSYDSPIRKSSSAVLEGFVGQSVAYPYDFAETNLDKLIAEYPEITGKGVTIGSVDTGVDGKHPALKGKIKLFMDGESKTITDPYDSDSHGTHTVGTMVGGNRTTQFIGMAPEASMVATAALFDYDSMLFGMEWMLNPDKDTDTNDAPKAVNNSWHAGGAPDMELFYKAIEAWEAAGILPVFSAGNAGRNGDRTITHPKEHPLAFAIGATGMSGKITDFSSRGPANYHGEDTEKPEITAPGEKINSTLPNGRYGKYDGTSMASPHVTGTVALLLQANPELNPQQLRIILRTTALPMGTASSASGWNKVYGHGKLDILAAVKSALGLKEFMFHGLDFIMKTPSALQAKFILSQGVNEEFDPSTTFVSKGESKWISAVELFR